MNDTLTALVATARQAARSGDMLPCLVLADWLAENGRIDDEQLLRGDVATYLGYDWPGLSQCIAWMAVDYRLEKILESC